MDNCKKYTGKILLGFKCATLAVCTVVGGYGILYAPESDQVRLEQELKENEQVFKTVEMVSEISASSHYLSSKNVQKGKKKATSPEISVIGDSVFLGAAPAFKKLYKNAVIDAKISRQVYHGLDVAKSMKKKNRLGDTVIISLGSNGRFSQEQGQKLINYLGKKRTIYWVDAYGKKLPVQNYVNRIIHKLVKKNSNVYLIPWSKEGKKHPGWFYQDGIHLNAKGQTGFSRFIKKSISSAK